MRQCRNEAFTDAINRFGLSKEHLLKRRVELPAIFVIYVAIILIVSSFLFAASISEYPFSDALMSIGVLIVVGSKFIASQIRIAQIRVRLFGFKAWLRDIAK